MLLVSAGGFWFTVLAVVLVLFAFGFWFRVCVWVFVIGLLLGLV